MTTDVERTDTGGADDSIDPADDSAVATERKVVYGTAGLAVLGSVLPWYSVLGVSVLGIEGDGLIALVVALLVAALTWYLDRLKRAMTVAIGGGAVIALVALYHVTGVSDVGVYLTLVAGVGMLAAGANGYRTLRSR